MERDAHGQPNPNDLLVYLPGERREPVRAFVTELLCSCPYCGSEVRRDSARGLDAGDGLGCLACVTAVIGPCSVCRADVTRKTSTTR